MLMEITTDVEQRNLVECIQVSANNLLTIVNDILDFSKIEAGKMRLDSVSFKVAKLVRNVVRALEHAAQQKSLELLYVEELPADVKITGDPGRIGQVLTNILANALKFTSHGSVKLTCTLETDSIARFCVEDTGIGID